MNSLCRSLAPAAVVWLAASGNAAESSVLPACWESPQMLYLGEPPPDLVERVHPVRAPVNDGDGLVVHNPDTSQPPPWRAALDVPLPAGDTLRVLLDGVSGPIAPKEFGASLVYVRVPWGRTTFSDLLIDRSAGKIVAHEHVIDGTDAWRQARESCQLPEMAGDAACRCSGDIEPWERPRANPEPESILGLLVLSDLFAAGETGGVGMAEPVVPLPLYSAPVDGTTPVRLIDDASELAWREYAYEAGAAVVIGVRDGWHRIRLADGSAGWVRPDHADRFIPLDALFSGHLTYLTGAWAGQLWRSGRGGWRAFGIDHDHGHGRETPAEVVAIEADGDSLWLEVAIPETSPCEGGGAEIRARGWVPAWNRKGKLNVWFYSRGC